jgi:hypothetical protein
VTTDLRAVAVGVGLLLASSVLFSRMGVGDVSALLAAVAVGGVLVAAAQTASADVA